MRKLIFIAFMVMSVCGYAQKYEVGTTTAVWKAPAAADFLHAKATGVKYVEVAFNQCYRGVPVDEVIPRIKEMKAKIDSADIEVWSIHLPFSRTLDISVLDDRLRKENVDFMAEMIELCAMFQPTCLVLHPSSEPIADSIRAQRIANASESIAYLKKYADAKVVIKGYASPEGSAEVNARIAAARAEAVKTILVNKYKINASRITAEGQGVGDMFTEPDWNRVSICTIED